MKIRKLQWLRRSVQISVVGLLLAAPLLARYTNYLLARELDDSIERWDGTVQGEALNVADQVIRAFPGGETERAGKVVRDRNVALERAQAIRGGPWSAEIFGVSMTDPLAAAESIAASGHFPWVLAVGVALPILITLILGRVFCSWICPMGFFLEIVDKGRSLLKFLELRPGNVKVQSTIKYAVLAAGLIGAFFLGQPLLGAIYPPAIIGREVHESTFALFDRAEHGQPGFWIGGFSLMAFFLLGIGLFELLISRRWWCKSICPGGALYSLLGATRPIRVERNAKACTACGACNAICPMALRPMQDQMGIDCDNCGLCISHCGDKALDYKLWDKLRPNRAPKATPELPQPQEAVS